MKRSQAQAQALAEERGQATLFVDLLELRRLVWQGPIGVGRFTAKTFDSGFAVSRERSVAIKRGVWSRNAALTLRSQYICQRSNADQSSR